MNWTVEQVLALAPDSRSAKAGSQLAIPQKWESLGQNEQAVWGKCRDSQRPQHPIKRKLIIAAQFASLQIPCFACTPDLFPDLMAATIKRVNISHRRYSFRLVQY